MNEFDNINKKQIFDVPEGFHEQLRANILQKTVATKKSNPILKLWRISAAASIILVMGGLWLHFQNKNNARQAIENQIIIENQMAVHEVELHDLTEYAKLTDEEIAEILPDK